MKTKILFIMTMLSTFEIMNAQSNITKFIEQKIVGKETPGFQYIIADTSGILYEYYGGYANIREEIPVSSTTEFKVYSATKTLTALSILQLIEEGKLHLEDDPGEILELPFSGPITVRQILSHTGGMTGAPFVTEIHPAEDHESFDPSESRMRMIDKGKELIYSPGKKKKYSNFGYLILGMLVEKISGKQYEDYVAENIFSKMEEGLPYGFQFNENTAKAYQKRKSLMHLLYSLLPNVKPYYSGKEGKFMGYNDLYINHSAYGGAFSSARGLIHYAQTLMQENSPLISDSGKELLFEEQYLASGKSAEHTLGWFLKEKNGIRYYTHPGGGGGYSCEVRIYPDKGIVSAYMMNTTQLFSHLKLLDKLDRQFIK